MTGLKNIGKNISTRPINSQLKVAAIAAGLIYLLVFTLPFLLPGYYSTTPPVDYTKLTKYSTVGFIVYVVGIAILFWLYVWAINITRPKRATPKQLPTHPPNKPFSLAVLYLRQYLFSPTPSLPSICSFTPFVHAAGHYTDCNPWLHRPTPCPPQTPGWGWPANGWMPPRLTARCGSCFRWVRFTAVAVAIWHTFLR